jgi:hypothetical protein
MNILECILLPVYIVYNMDSLKGMLFPVYILELYLKKDHLEVILVPLSILVLFGLYKIHILDLL